MKTTIKFLLLVALSIAPTLAKGIIYNPDLDPNLHVVSKDANIDINTKKIVRIYGTIDYQSLQTFTKDMDRAQTLYGDIVILIKSPGGMADVGQKMIDAIHKEQIAGIRVICLVDSYASSMAFNILTNCDVRLMTPGSLSLVHKIAVRDINARMTAHNLRIVADVLEKDDERYRQANALAMHLSLEKYDSYADRETYWLAFTLLRMGYLHGLAYVKK